MSNLVVGTVQATTVKQAGVNLGNRLCPVGTVVDYAGLTEPTGWLFCYGQAVSRTTYADLFTAISTTYGVGNGSTTFNLPDCRGRVVAGQDDMGGSSANRLTNQSGGLNGDTLGATGGAETHTLSSGESALQSHTHTVSAHQHFVFADDTETSNVQVSASEYASAQGNYGSQSNYIIAGKTTPVATVGLTSSAGGGSTGSQSASATAHNNVQPTIILNKIIFTGV